jgi:hypothetical protein
MYISRADGFCMVLPHLSFLSMALQVIDLCPEDWAVVIATRGVFAVARPKHGVLRQRAQHKWHGPTKSWALC